MKKQYTTPRTEVISVTRPQLLAGSELPFEGGETEIQLAPSDEFFFDIEGDI